MTGHWVKYKHYSPLNLNSFEAVFYVEEIKDNMDHIDFYAPSGKVYQWHFYVLGREEAKRVYNLLLAEMRGLETELSVGSGDKDNKNSGNYHILQSVEKAKKILEKQVYPSVAEQIEKELAPDEKTARAAARITKRWCKNTLCDNCFLVGQDCGNPERWDI